MKDICTTFAIVILNVYTFLNVYTMDIRVVITSDAIVVLLRVMMKRWNILYYYIYYYIYYYTMEKHYIV